MTEIKAVIFDYGNVLCHEHLDSDLQEMAKCIGVDWQTFKEAYWHYRLDYDAGRSFDSHYYQMVAEMCAASITAEQIKQCIDFDNAGWSRPNQPMVDWAHRLRAHGTKIAILSNMPQDFRDFFSTCTWLPEFHHSTFSCELKAVKPAHDIYHHAIEGLGVAPESVLFIDDRLPNIEAAKELGWHGFVFTNASDLHEFIKDTNLPAVLLEDS